MLVLVVSLMVRKILKTGKQEKNVKDVESLSTIGVKNFLMALGVSFVSSLMTVGYTAVIYFVSNTVSSSIDYQYQVIVTILLIVISFAIYALILVGPAILVGYKKGLSYGVGSFALTVVWLIIFGAVAVFVLYIFKGQQNYPTPFMVKSGTEMLNSSELK
jgi:hypothetical protein